MSNKYSFSTWYSLGIAIMVLLSSYRYNNRWFTFKSVGDDIVAIDLKVDNNFINSLEDEELNKNIKRLYNRRDWK